MLLEQYDHFDKIMMMIFDKENQRVIECLFFDSLEDYAKAIAKLSPLYSHEYPIYKLPVSIDNHVNINRTKIFKE
jgi:hypothetical protein